MDWRRIESKSNLHIWNEILCLQKKTMDSLKRKKTRSKHAKTKKEKETTNVIKHVKVYLCELEMFCARIHML